MAISSNEISNIISGQVGMFSASAQYAQAISNQYGFQAGGSIGIQDPRDQSAAQLQAGNIGAFGARLPGYAVGGAAMMSMFNVAPRMLDPFTMGAHMVRRGYMGGGMAGAVGMGLGAAGLMYGASAATGFMTNNMVSGAQNRGLLNSQIGNIFPHMNSGGLNMMAGQVEAMSRQGMGSIRELASLMQQGAATGALDTGSLNQFSQSFRKLVTNVRQVANVLNSSMTEASQAMQSVKAIGVRSGEAANFLGAAKGIGTAANLSPGQMMGAAQAGSQFGFSAGIGRQSGAMGSMVSAGVYNMASNSENYNVDAGSQGRYTQAATRFLLGRHGRTVLGAMMTRDGEFDASRAAMIARGAYSREELREMYNANINNQTMRRHLRNRGTEIAGQFISQFGPEAISGSLEAMTRGSVDGVGRDTEMLQQTLTGLNRRDISNMKQLAASAPMLRQKLISEARAGFQEGQRSVSATQLMGIAFDRMIKPLKDQFRQYGADMTRAAGDAMEEVTRTFVKNPGARPDFAGLHQMNTAMARGGEIGSFYAPGSSFGGGGGMNLATMPGRATGWGSFANYLPSGLRMGAMPEGTSLSELPGGGFSTLNPMDGASLAAGAMALRYSRVFPGNRNLIGGFGAGLNWAGKQYDRLATMGMPRGPGGAIQHPWMGLTGVNTLRGAARIPTGALRTAGFLGMGLGRLAGAATLPLMAYGALTSGPSVGRRISGLEGISEGAISGNNARLLQGLKEVGFLGDTDIEYANIQDMTRTNYPGTPIAGVTGADGAAGGTGYQGFLTPSGGEEIERLYASGTSTGNDYLTSAFGKIQGKVGGVSRSEIMANIENMFAGDTEELMNMDASTRVQAIVDRVSQKYGGKQFGLSQKELTALAFTQNKLLGFQSTKEYYKGRTGAGARKIHADKIRSILGSKEGVALVGAGNQEFARDYATIVGGDGAQGLHDAQVAFQDHGRARASSILETVIGDTTGLTSDKRDLRNYILSQMGTGSGLSNLSQQATDLMGGGYSKTLSPIVREEELKRINTANDAHKADFQSNNAKYSYALTQGNQFLGHGRVDVGAEMDRLQTQGVSALYAEDSINDGIAQHIGRLFKAGLEPSEVAVRNASDAYMRGGVAGEYAATKLTNVYNLHKDYKSVKHSKDANAKFLTKAARRMGLEIDFSQFDSAHDRAALRGTYDPKAGRGISSKLQASLSAFGRELRTLQGDAEVTGREAEQEAAKVLDLLSKHKGDATEVIDQMTTMRPPGSVSSGKAMKGGLKEQVGAIDSALADLQKAIESRAKKIRDGET